MLIECEPAIKSIIVHINSEKHDFIIEDLDEQRVVVKENMVYMLKLKLEEVCRRHCQLCHFIILLISNHSGELPLFIIPPRPAPLVSVFPPFPSPLRPDLV